MSYSAYVGPSYKCIVSMVQNTKNNWALCLLSGFGMSLLVTSGLLLPRLRHTLKLKQTKTKIRSCRGSNRLVRKRISNNA